MIKSVILPQSLRQSARLLVRRTTAQPLDFLDLDEKSLFLNWKLVSAQKSFMDGPELSSIS